jgi:hypothetical protein
VYACIYDHHQGWMILDDDRMIETSRGNNIGREEEELLR